MLLLGSYQAMNLDGGGSTVMWSRRRAMCQRREPVGCLINRPTHGERTVVQSIGIVP